MNRILSVLVSGLLVIPVFAGVVPASYATPSVSTLVSADARDRAQLKAGLQRSWAKTNSSARYKACWMWNNRPDVVQSGLIASFRGQGFSISDIYTAARSHFNSVC